MIVKARPHEEALELADHAEFEEMERSWVGVVPAERSARQPATA